jgi:hypothetical protein
MIRRYCDVCGVEILNLAADERIKKALNGIVIEVIVGVYKGAWNSGDFCVPCVIKTVVEGVPYGVAAARRGEGIHAE